MSGRSRARRSSTPLRLALRKLALGIAGIGCMSRKRVSAASTSSLHQARACHNPALLGPSLYGWVLSWFCQNCHPLASSCQATKLQDSKVHEIRRTCQATNASPMTWTQGGLQRAGRNSRHSLGFVVQSRKCHAPCRLRVESELRFESPVFVRSPATGGINSRRPQCTRFSSPPNSSSNPMRRWLGKWACCVQRVCIYRCGSGPMVSRAHRTILWMCKCWTALPKWGRPARPSGQPVLCSGLRRRSCDLARDHCCSVSDRPAQRSWWMRALNLSDHTSTVLLLPQLEQVGTESDLCRPLPSWDVQSNLTP